ncbi:MAG TPA: hypothetical protein VNT79_11715 [Phycisphaerae bacterium]|nr:hypothetical protein [Phycisphaerae bacterium]
MHAGTIRRALCLFVGGAVIVGGASQSHAQPSGVPTGFSPHIQPVKGGEVDWGNGFLIVHGEGRARGRSSRDRLMAERAASLVAARNALATSMRIQVDADGTFATVRDGSVHIRGRVKGQKVTSADWRPDENPPACRVKMRVPLWGLKGLGAVVYDRERREANGHRGERIALSEDRIDVRKYWLIVDARGLQISPCLFPVIVDDTGRTLYDIGAVETPRNAVIRPVGYAETTMSWTELEEWAEHGEAGSDSDIGAEQRTDTDGQLVPQLTEAQAGRSSTSLNSRRVGIGPRRGWVVRASKTAASGNGDIVLETAVAEQLAKSPKQSSLLRNGRVIIVVDSATRVGQP